MSGEEDGYSSSDSDISMSDLPWIQQFELLCSSDDISIDELHRMTEGISLDTLHNSSFLHRLCFNDNITLEMVQFLLDLYPQAINSSLHLPEAGIFSAFPLHLACFNKDCPNEVIQLLLQKKNLYQLTFMCHMGFDWDKTGIIIHNGNKAHGGLPLHYYLSRTSNVDLNIVKQLVTTNLGVLLLADENTKSTPIHILLNNKSIGDMFDVVKYLVESNPSSLVAKDEHDQTPLDVACSNNKSITVEIIELFLRVCPSSIHQRNNCQCLPIHSLCGEAEKEDEVAIDILRLLLEAHPDSVSQTDGQGYPPLHLAAMNKSPAFCKILVDAYPELVKRVDDDGDLPFHNACYKGRPDTLEYLLTLYPEALHIRNDDGYLPIHEVFVSSPNNDTAKIVEFLLRHDPECLSKEIVSTSRGNQYRQGNGALPLHIVSSSRDESNVTELLFDLYPEAILIRNERQQLPIDVLREKRATDNHYNYEERLNEVINFLQTQMIYARQAKDGKVMGTFDCTGSSPLTRAIRARAPLGSIKLLVKGNPDAIRIADRGMRSLDIASEVSTIGVVKYLVELSPDRLNTCGFSRNFPLHYACRGGNCEVISYLLETPISSASVSEKNSDGMLPIHLFCEFVSKQEEEEDTPEYTETIWRLLTAYPETVLNW